METTTVLPIWRDFDKLKEEAQQDKGFFYYVSYGRPVIIKGKALDRLTKGKSLFLMGAKFLHKESLNFRYY